MCQRPQIAMAMLAGCGLLGLASCNKSEAAPTQIFASRAGEPPVVVELFQSQGCSSCPPANADLNALADRRDVLALSFAVTYWDRLGWKDTFGSPHFTARQQRYANAGRGEVATPEFIVNGAYAVVGSSQSALETTIARAGPLRGGPQISLNSSRIRIEAAPTGTTATVWLVRYDPRTQNVPIRAGENGGRTLPHRNIVRELVKLGDWNGAGISFALTAPLETGLATAVLVQRDNGPIISARKLY